MAEGVRCSPSVHRLFGLVGKACPSRVADLTVGSSLSGSSHTGDSRIGTLVASHTSDCQAPGIIGSALGLVGPVSVYCDWVR